MTTEPEDSAHREQANDAMPEGEETPPPGAKAMAFVRWVIVAGAAILAAFMWLSYAKTQLSAAKPNSPIAAPKYHCPMHPQIVSDAPGECPICHMSLELIEREQTPAPNSAADANTTNDAQESPPPAGTKAITLALDRVQAIGVRTAVAETQALSGTLRATASVVPREQGASEVHVRTPGFVEAVHVDQTGVKVAFGQAMLSVFSPSLLQAQNELLAVSDWAPSAGATAAASARRKLELLGMPTVEIERLIRTRESLHSTTITAPRGGFVTKKNVVVGSYVTPEMTLYEVQDLSKVSVVAEISLTEMGSVRVGSEGRFVPASDQNRAEAATVDLIYPLVTPDSRTRRVRLVMRKDALSVYAPGEYGTVEFEGTKDTGVSIPRDALIDTGLSSYVFVVESGGRFRPRIVTTESRTQRAENNVCVKSGLAAGERVVSGATFLIDAESRLQASFAGTPEAPARTSR